jgi:hypothetical protein
MLAQPGQRLGDRSLGWDERLLWLVKSYGMHLWQDRSGYCGLTLISGGSFS